MTKLNYNLTIDANPDKVWQVLWDDSTYRKWAGVFQEGSYAVSDWKEGSKIQFLNKEGEGMDSIISECKPKVYMAFKHLGIIKDFKELPDNEEAKSWIEFFETYSLKKDDGKTTLNVILNSPEQYADYFNRTFPQALSLIKELAEHPILITVQALIKAPVEKVWEIWTTPKHITQWNTASADWHTPYAENDLKVGGKFLSRMEAIDGSFGFDFWGIYDEIISNALIAYTMGDDRKAKVTFERKDNSTKVVVIFEAESENSIELQQGGWQAILNNFKKYTESKPSAAKQKARQKEKSH